MIFTYGLHLKLVSVHYTLEYLSNVKYRNTVFIL